MFLLIAISAANCSQKQRLSLVFTVEKMQLIDLKYVHLDSSGSLVKGVNP